MKDRHYKLITAEEINNEVVFSYKNYPIQSEDLFDGDLEMLAFDIKYLYQADKILSMLDLKTDENYFFNQCKEVIAVPEKHINEKGEGKLTFQSYFKNFPESTISTADDAIVVIALNVNQDSANAKAKEYSVVCYIHVNRFKHQPLQGETQNGFYYNLLRLSERKENGIKIYKGKRIFTAVFTVLHDLVDVVGNVHFTYGCMGKENQIINTALASLAKKYNKEFEKWPVRTNTIINYTFGSSSAAKKIIDITNNSILLDKFYTKIKESRENQLFFHLNTIDDFYALINRITTYSKTSKIFAILDKNEDIKAAVFAMNWGDYFSLTLENPKGLFKAIANMKITDQILYPFLLVGDVENAKTLLKGVTQYFRKEHKVYVSLLNSYAGDKYWDIKKSPIFDDYYYFSISDKPELMEKMKQKSLNAKNNHELYIDTCLM